MTESELPDPRATDEEHDDEEAGAPTEPSHDQVLVEDDYAEGGTADPDGAHRDAPAGEDYAGSGF